MTDIEIQRLAALHLEDLAYVALSARADGVGFELYPTLKDDTRIRLRSRIRQIGRYDWPTSMREDPSVRRGYTLRQCYRLITALILLDAYLPPSLVMMIARNNEFGFLDVISRRLAEPLDFGAHANDSIGVIVPGEIRDVAGFPISTDTEPDRVHFLPRASLDALWAGKHDSGGARLTVDIATAAISVWRWLIGRRLFDDAARIALLEEARLYERSPSYLPVAGKQLRR